MKYFNGDKVKYTGKKEIIYGGLFYEYILLEGINKGKKGWTQRKENE